MLINYSTNTRQTSNYKRNKYLEEGKGNGWCHHPSALCSSSACEFWNCSAAHHRSYFLLHPATQHPLEQTRQRHAAAIKSASSFFSLFICHCVPMTRLLLLPPCCWHTLHYFLLFSPFVLRSRFPIPPFPLSYHTSFLFLLPAPRLIFHFAALPLISQRACGLTEMQGSDGGCQTVSTYLFTQIHTCIH